MPFFVAWTDLEPAQRARSRAQWLWVLRPVVGGQVDLHRGGLRRRGPRRHAGHGGGALRDGVFGRERILARASPPGPGPGREMREAMLQRGQAAPGLRRSWGRGGVERRLRGQRRLAGHVAGDPRRGERRGSGHPARPLGARHPPSPRPRRLASRRHDATEIIGLEGCLDMFLGLPVGSAPGPSGANAMTRAVRASARH